MTRDERKRTVELYINQERKAAFEKVKGKTISVPEVDENGREVMIEYEVDTIKTLFYIGFDKLISEL